MKIVDFIYMAYFLNVRAIDTTSVDDIGSNIIGPILSGLLQILQSNWVEILNMRENQQLSISEKRH